MDSYRLKQVLRYGWSHAGQISADHFGGEKRLSLFFDIVKTYFRYGMWSNQYLSESFWKLAKQERKTIGERYCKINRTRESWLRDFNANRSFLNKWSSFKLETSARKREKRSLEYAKRYGMGVGSIVEYGVIISRQHYSDGTFSVGQKVLLARNADLDYTGDLIICDGVAISEGVKILTHSHDVFRSKDESELIPLSNRAYKTRLTIKKNARIGAHAIIMPGVGEIGENSFVSAGSVVTKKVPDNVVVAGNPAQVVVKIPRSVKVVPRC